MKHIHSLLVHAYLAVFVTTASSSSTTIALRALQQTCSVPQIQKEREQMIGTFLRAAGAVGDFRNVSNQLDYLSNVLDANVSLQIDFVGTYNGLSGYQGYISLLNPIFNDKMIGIDSRDVVSVQWMDDNTAAITLLEHWNKPNSSAQQEFQSHETITFLPCSTKVINQHILPSQGLKLIGDSTSSKMSPSNICSLAGKACTDELFPFDDMNQCIDFFAAVPLECNDGQNSLMGNTTSCRFVYAVAAQLDPITHCPLMAINSPVCAQSACIGGKYSTMTSADFGADLLPPQWSASANYAISIITFILLILPALIFIAEYMYGRRFLKLVRKPPSGLYIKKLSTRQFRSLNLNINSLCYEIKGRRILQNVSMGVESGLYAIMGTSGAGKSTLFSVITQTGVGKIASGSVQLKYGSNGRALTKSEVSNAVRVIEQDPQPFADANSQLTVRESIMLTAMTTLKYKGLSGAALESAIALADDAIEETSLGSAANTALDSLSGGQLKRWSIACKLVTRPACLLLDEPTSSLDSASALSVMMTLRMLADSGRIVIATLHQPRSSIVALIDDILLLRPRAPPLYFGPLEPFGRVMEARNAEIRDLFGFIFQDDENNSTWCNDAADALIGMYKELDVGCCGVLTAKGLGRYFEIEGWTEAQWHQCLLANNVLSEAASNGSCEVSLKDFSSWIEQAMKNAGKIPPFDRLALDTVLKWLASHDEHQEPSWPSAILEAYKRQDSSFGIATTTSTAALLMDDSLADIMADMCDRPDIDLRLNPELELDQNAVHISSQALVKAAPWSTDVSLVKAKAIQKPSIWYRISADAVRSIKGSSIAELVSYMFGSLVIGCLLGLIFPQLHPTSIDKLYLYPSSLLLGICAGSNLNIFNFSTTIIRKENALRKQQLREQTVSPGVVLWEISSRAFLFNWLAGMTFFFPIYFIVRFYVGSVDFGSLVMQLFSIVLLMDVLSALADMSNFFFNSSVAALIPGLWLAWNSLFAGVLIKLNQLFVIWYPWAMYVTPFWHVINIWMYKTFYGVHLECGKYDQPHLCPPEGSDAVAEMQYGQITWEISLLVLWLTLIVYNVVFYFGLVWYCRRFTSKKTMEISGGVGSEEKKEGYYNANGDVSDDTNGVLV